MFFRFILLAVLVYFSINLVRRFLTTTFRNQQPRNPFSPPSNSGRTPRLDHIEDADFTEITDESKTSEK